VAVLRLARRATHYNWETVGSTKQWAAPNSGQHQTGGSTKQWAAPNSGQHQTVRRYAGLITSPTACRSAHADKQKIPNQVT